MVFSPGKPKINSLVVMYSIKSTSSQGLAVVTSRRDRAVQSGHIDSFGGWNVSIA